MPPLVPLCSVSLDVDIPQDIRAKHNRSYFLWEYGKAPEVAIEVISDNQGVELDEKKSLYAQIGVNYFVVWDPQNLSAKGRLSIFEYGERKRYRLMKGTWLPEVGLELTIWHGKFEGLTCDWLRWCDERGEVIPTGEEIARQENHRAEQEKQRADRLAAQLRALGVEPQP
ncbi:MAG: Uma2 family endonuclease [Gemmataceae bacterium]|nr:Uma2 family endonuclease [Gemmataceae bacterium]MCI0742686.1 Uma2 family endonuclease [Gemmataceae bacterium]